jgi:hypothetical protein
LDEFYEATAGNALFVVESARVGLLGTALDASREDRTLPPRIETVISARLAQLPSGTRELVSLGAVVGETFSVDLLVCASGNSEDEVLRDLDLLWRRGIIREQAGDYLFAHPHIQAVALASVGAPERNRLNRRVARAIEQLYGTESAAVSRRLASHYEDAALYDEAVAAYRRAAMAALEIYANEEAIRSIERALVLLAKLPEGRERDRTELDLLMTLGPPLVITKGYAAPRAVEVYSRARELSRALGAPGLAAPALRGLAIAYIVRGELNLAEDMGAELLGLASKLANPMLTVEAHYSLGVVAFWRGELERSREELELAVTGCEQVDHAAHIALYSQSPLVIGLVRLGFTLWHLGFDGLALEKQARALALAEELGQPYSLGYALTFSAWLAYCRGDAAETARHSERLIALCVEHSMRYWVPVGHLLLGWCTMVRGDVDQGISVIETTVASIAEEDRLNRSFALMLLAHGRARVTLEAAARTFDEAHALVEQTGVRWLEAELLRTQAEFESARGATMDAVEGLLSSARDIARRQRSRMYEVRTTYDLAVLWRANGRTADAVAALEAIAADPDQSRQNQDQRRAAALLEQLRREAAVGPMDQERS